MIVFPATGPGPLDRASSLTRDVPQVRTGEKPV